MTATLQFNKTTSDLGGAATATQVSATALNNIFDNVSPDEATAGDVEYRAIDIKNVGDATAAGVQVYCDGTPNTGTDIQFAIEASPLGSTQAIANESAAPTISGSFTAYTTGSRLSLPDIPAGSYVRLWLKRIVNAACPNMANDGTTITVEYA